MQALAEESFGCAEGFLCHDPNVNKFYLKKEQQNLSGRAGQILLLEPGSLIRPPAGR